MPDNLSDAEKNKLDEYYESYTSTLKKGMNRIGKVDVVFPESVRRSMGESKILEYALHHNPSLLISVCAEGKEVNITGDWVKLSEDLAKQLSNYTNVSHGTCPECSRKMIRH
jgi:hypothetical protein